MKEQEEGGWYFLWMGIFCLVPTFLIYEATKHGRPGIALWAIVVLGITGAVSLFSASCAAVIALCDSSGSGTRKPKNPRRQIKDELSREEKIRQEIMRKAEEQHKEMQKFIHKKARR